MSYFSVNDGGGNSIFDIAYRFKQMELREMEKVPTTIRQNKMSGSDTGSSDFLTKLQELHSMIFHIDKKSDVQITELNTIDRTVQSLNRSFKSDRLIKKYYEEFIKERESTDLVEFLPRLKQYSIKSSGDFNEKFNKLLKDAGSDKKVWSLLLALKDVVSIVREKVRGGKDVKDLKALADAKDIYNTFIIARQAELGDAMSQDTFDKLSKVNDSIPNLLKSILKMVNELVSQSNGKSEVWGGEYDDKNKRKLDETIKEIETEFNALGNRPSVKQYIRIYKQIEEPLGILIINVKGMIDNTVTFRGPQQFSLQPLKVITPEELNAIQQSLGKPKLNQLVDVAREFEAKLYPYVDDDNDIIDEQLDALIKYLKKLLVSPDDFNSWSPQKIARLRQTYNKLKNRYENTDTIKEAIKIVEQLKFDVYTRTLAPELDKEEREKKYNEEARGRFTDQTGQFVGGGKRRKDAKQYLDPEYYHFINTMPKKRFL